MILLGIFTVIPARAEVSVKASLSHHSFPVNRAAQLSITIRGSSSSATIQLPDIKNVTFHSQGQSTQVNIVNGNYSSSLTRSYMVQVAEPGKYTIPPIRVNDSGKTFSTKAINFEATPAGTLANSSAGSEKTTVNDIAFIRIAQSGNHFTGEMVPVTIKAYFREKYRFSQIDRPVLKGDGVVMSPLPEEPEQTRESLGGSWYNVISWKTALSGIKTGKHPISFTLNCSLIFTQQRRSLSPFGGNSLFDDSFFNNFLSGYQRKSVTLTSGELSFNVIPIPGENQPADFSGAIGDFTMQVKVTPIEIEIGEPLTLTIDISGKGNFDRVNAPSFPKSPQWKTYAPTAEFTRQGNIFSGTKKFEQAVIAKTDKARNIPSLSFSYFNPHKRKFFTINSGEIPIKVQQANQPVQKQPVVSTPQHQQQITTTPSAPVAEVTGLAPMYLKPGSFHRQIVPLFQKSWFIALSVLCFLVLLTLIFLRIRLNSISRNPEIRRRQLALQLLAKDLHSVERAKTSGDNLTFLMACRTTIQNMLGFIWHTEPAAISLEDIRTRLENDSQLITIFEAAGQAAYGGETLSDKQMQHYSTILKTELETLL
jgi:hypothetical protein